MTEPPGTRYHHPMDRAVLQGLQMRYSIVELAAQNCERAGLHRDRLYKCGRCGGAWYRGRCVNCGVRR